MSLNENQRRAVAVTLRLLEEQIADIKRTMERDERGILYQRIADFTPLQRTRMRETISAIRKEIRRAVERFYLPTQERSATQEIAGALSLAWESLEEVRSHKLKSYGAVDPSLKETLDPIVQRLIRLVYDLEDAARNQE